MMSRHPEVLWAEREDRVYLTVMLTDAKDVEVNLHSDCIFAFSGSTGDDDKCYELELELFAKVDMKESKVNIGAKKIFCILMKAEKKWWNKLLRGDGKLPHYVKVDWDKWVDEDEDDDKAPADVDTGGMDFSKFGAMAGSMGGGYGSLGGMGQEPNMVAYVDVPAGKHPEVWWAEREDKVYLTVTCVDAKDAKVNLDPEGVFTFYGSYGVGDHYNWYELKLELLDKVEVEESKVQLGVKKIFCILMKAEKKWWNKLLRGDGKSPHYVNHDEKAPSDVDTGVMNFLKFGDIGGGPGYLGSGTVVNSDMILDFDCFSEKDGKLTAHYKNRKYFEIRRLSGLPEDDDSSLVPLDHADGSRRVFY